MFSNIPRRKVPILLIFGVLVIIYNFGLGPVQKFFKVLGQCLSEFNWRISRNAEDVKIYIWTHKLKDDYSEIYIGDSESLLRAGFNSSYPVKITIHGFSDRAVTTWTKSVKRNYYQVGHFNIFTIDWELLALSPWFNTACKNTKIVGEKTARLINWLVKDINITYESIHVLGSSMGAQAAGYAGHFTKGKLGRVTGLDPSGPLFYSVTNEDRLDHSDAQFVDIIHTAGYWIGSTLATGHVDIWPNGGLSPQPGCEKKESLDLSCSHFKAWRLFSSSIINPDSIIGLKCDNYDAFLSGSCCNSAAVIAKIGDKINITLRGSFYLITDSQGAFDLPQESSTLCHF